MKILAIHNIGFVEPEKESGIDRWRIYSPLEELKKHVDWQIDYQKGIIKEIDKYKSQEEFTDEELEKAAEQLGQYDIVFSSYHASPTAFSLMHIVNKRYGTKYVMDDDDDIFSIDPYNPFWLKMSDNEAFAMQRMIRLAPYLTTTNELLKSRYEERSEVNGRVFVLPNYITDDYKEYDPDNGEKIVIGFAGSSSHYKDLNYTGALEAVAKIMHKHKNVEFHCVGVPADVYLPRARYKLLEPIPGRDWTTKLFPKLNFDISIAPLEHTIFNETKSNIKWQESTRMGAAVVASKYGPFVDQKGALLVDNTEESWYEAISSLLEKKARQKLVTEARKELEKWQMKDHWQEYKRVFEQIKGD